MKTTVSIIIPCYNEETLISHKIPHLLEIAKNTDTEIIVVDSPKSTDNTKGVLVQFPSVSYYKGDEKGRAKQMNFGAKKATGNVFVFLHADVTLPPNYFSLIEDCLRKNDCGFFNYKFDKEGFWMKFNASFVKKKGIFTGGGDQCHFYKRAIFEKLNGFNEEYCIMEDFEIIDRVKQNNIPYEIIETPVIVSARKYEKNSWLKISLINGYVFLSYKLGVPPTKLEKRYRSLIRK